MQYKGVGGGRVRFQPSSNNGLMASKDFGRELSGDHEFSTWSDLEYLTCAETIPRVEKKSLNSPWKNGQFTLNEFTVKSECHWRLFITLTRVLLRYVFYNKITRCNVFNGWWLVFVSTFLFPFYILFLFLWFPFPLDLLLYTFHSWTFISCPPPFLWPPTHSLPPSRPLLRTKWDKFGCRKLDSGNLGVELTMSL